jgi:hypothetical protein
MVGKTISESFRHARRSQDRPQKTSRFTASGASVASPVSIVNANQLRPESALEELQRYLGTRMYLRPKSGTRPGQLILEYHKEEQLTEIYDRLMR